MSVFIIAEAPIPYGSLDMAVARAARRTLSVSAGSLSAGCRT
jgi:hypothetical protein